MLDPRLVPWPAMLWAVGCSLPLVLLAWALWKRPALSLPLMVLAPVTGWLAGIVQLQGWPKFPVLDVPMWSFWIAAFSAAVIAVWSGILPGKPIQDKARAVARNTESLLVMGVAIRGIVVFTLFRQYVNEPIPVPTWILALVAMLDILALRNPLSISRPGLFPAARFIPWLVALLGASLLLALTGTASVSLLCLALLFASTSGYLLVMLQEFRGKLPQGLNPGVALTALVFAWPVLLLSGPVFATTPWPSAVWMLATPAIGLSGVWLFEFTLRKNPATAENWKHRALAMTIAFLLAAAPTAYVVIQANIEAAKSDYHY